MKKLLSLTLAGVLAASGLAIFAGCGQTYEVEIDYNVDLSNPIDLVGLYPETGMSAFGKDDTAAIIEKTTGYKVDYKELGSNADNDVNKYLSSHADYHFMKLTEAQFHPYLERGTFCDLTELLQKTEAGRILYQLIDLMDYGWDSVTYVDEQGNKHIYGIPDFGYVSMTDSALIWNKSHLEQVGFAAQFPENQSGLPETMSEFDWAIHACQTKFGTEANNDSYHALGLPGSNSNEVTALKGAFEVPLFFYVDDEGQIQQYEFSPNATKYAQYMHMIRHQSILSDKWQNESGQGLYTKFARGAYSCVFLPYWNVTPLLDACVSYEKKNGGKGIANGIEGYDPAEDNNRDWLKSNAIGWQLRLRGDGFTFTTDDGQKVSCATQEKARIEGGPAGVSYYTVIPAYMQDKALYVIDFLAKKMLHFAEFYGGNGLSLEEQAELGGKLPEDTHWYEIATPEGAPGKEDYEGYLNEYIAKGYTPSVAAEMVEQDVYNQYEDLDNMVIFLRPYSYTYTRYTNKDASLGNKLSENEEELNAEEITVSKPGMWVKLTQRYITQINDNSQYCNGTNAISARILFHLRETGFGAWRVVIPTDDTLIQNPMAMCPPMKHWSVVSILTRSALKNAISSAIDAKPQAGVDIVKKTLDEKRQEVISTGGWTQEMVDEMTQWYNEVKLNRK